MTANILNSPDAVRMSIFVVRAFIGMRELLGSTKELARQLAALEKKLTARLDRHEVAIVEVLRRAMDILDPPPMPEPPRRQIGFPGKPLVDHLGGGIWELRSHLSNRIARTLFMLGRSEIVVLHGFIKKTQKTPMRELELARRRKRIYEQNYE
jgi:hypothetical protein